MFICYEGAKKEIENDKIKTVDTQTQIKYYLFIVMNYYFGNIRKQNTRGKKDTKKTNTFFNDTM